jgi:hypothetical protein
MAQSEWPQNARPWFNSRLVQETFLCSTELGLAVGPTQPPIPWVAGAVSPGTKRPGSEAQQTHLVPSSKMVEL